MIYVYDLFNGHGTCHRFLVFISLAVQKCIDRDVVMTKGITFMYMISDSRVKFPCLSVISVGSSCIVVTTQDDFFILFCLAVTQYFTPSMSSAHSMSDLVTG